MANTHPDDTASTDQVFARMNDGANALVLRQSATISAHSEAIRRLEEITRVVDTPYIGSYLSV